MHSDCTTISDSVPSQPTSRAPAQTFLDHRDGKCKQLTVMSSNKFLVQSTVRRHAPLKIAIAGQVFVTDQRATPSQTGRTRLNNPDTVYHRVFHFAHASTQAIRPSGVHNLTPRNAARTANLSRPQHNDSQGHRDCPSDSDASPNQRQPCRNARQEGPTFATRFHHCTYDGSEQHQRKSDTGPK